VNREIRSRHRADLGDELDILCSGALRAPARPTSRLIRNADVDTVASAKRAPGLRMDSAATRSLNSLQQRLQQRVRLLKLARARLDAWCGWFLPADEAVVPIEMTAADTKPSIVAAVARFTLVHMDNVEDTAGHPSVAACEANRI